VEDSSRIWTGAFLLLALHTKDFLSVVKATWYQCPLEEVIHTRFANEKQSITQVANYFNLAPYQGLIKQENCFESCSKCLGLESAAQKKTGENGPTEK